MKRTLIPLVFMWLKVFVCQGSVIYTDINPDVTKVNSNYSLDINKDLTQDFNISAGGNSSVGFIYCNSLDTSKQLFVSNSTDAKPFTSGMSIGASTTNGYWANGSNFFLYAVGGSSSAGSFTNNTDYYLGLRIRINGNYHYGWARVSVNTTTMSVTIRDYAYESFANKAITTSAILAINTSPNFSSEVVVATDRIAKQLKISLVNENLPITGVVVYDITGRVVKRIIESDREESKHIIINIEGFAVGSYLIQVSTDVGIQNKKIVIAD